MRRETLQRLFVALFVGGVVLFATAMLGFMIVPLGGSLLPTVIMYAALACGLVGFLGYFVMRVAPAAARMRQVGWRGFGKAKKAGLVMVAAAGLAAVTWITIVPPIRNAEIHCSGEPAFGPWPDRAWLAVRRPQFGSWETAYVAEQDITYVVAGCGHGTFDFALRLQGNHTGLDDFRFLAAPSGHAIAPGFQPVNESLGLSVDRATDEVFEPRSPAVHAAAAIALVLLATFGIALVALPDWWGLRPQIGSLLGAWVGWATLEGGLSFGAFLIGIPVLLFAFGSGAIMTAASGGRPRLRVVGLALLFFALALFLMTALLIDAYPSEPDA